MLLFDLLLDLRLCTESDQVENLAKLLDDLKEIRQMLQRLQATIGAIGIEPQRIFKKEQRDYGILQERQGKLCREACQICWWGRGITCDHFANQKARPGGGEGFQSLRICGGVGCQSMQMGQFSLSNIRPQRDSFDTIKNCICQPAGAQIGSGEKRTMQVRMAKVGPVEIRSLQVHLGQFGLTQIGPSQIDFTQNRPVEIGGSEDCACERSPIENGYSEIGPAEVRLAELC